MYLCHCYVKAYYEDSGVFGNTQLCGLSAQRQWFFVSQELVMLCYALGLCLCQHGHGSLVLLQEHGIDAPQVHEPYTADQPQQRWKHPAMHLRRRHYLALGPCL